ncbi:hypothetical protein MNEG_1327 [Monoraphidium neglectum]|uniref:Uncharacterized protein n=1 Tax=Monoraphidium neglectum TaxID=145388 RepID=A0A0D2MVU8_9CHLO|nr:hypothetical protein MNEG_1327 [Monoraphidium neglectum]KIZ06625.1 hypothetical protein MNEG_1327 [Monoraphidium neglectum]|eukprot:XP_013905644.1 hypothetical protein MNEG_1327 [Monoraphidium neglectum]
MPLNSAAVDFASRRFKPSGVAVDLETPDGKRVGVLGVELQMLTSNRTRSIVADAVRRMRLMAAISSNQRALSRAASASAMQPKTIAKSGEAASRSASHT